MSANRLYQTIAAKLRKLIEDGEFPPGSRLPGERELAERFGVSRVTVREAEIALEAQGWIAIRIGSGVYVKPRPAQASGGLPDVSAFDLTAARAVFEAEAAALAASNLDDDGIAELQVLAEALCRRDLSDEEAGEYDRRFHLTIARLSGNPVVEYFVQQIWRMRSELPRVTEVYARVCHDDGASRADEHMAIPEGYERPSQGMRLRTGPDLRSRSVRQRNSSPVRPHATLAGAGIITVTRHGRSSLRATRLGSRDRSIERRFVDQIRVVAMNRSRSCCVRRRISSSAWLSVACSMASNRRWK